VYCGNVPAIQNGFIIANDSTAGSIGTVFCNPLHKLRGRNFYTCSLNGAWTGFSRCGKLYFLLSIQVGYFM